jgi:uncharacterized membrane protein YphA (DoxX/SURF4 family)
MMRGPWRWLVLVGRVALGGVFLYAAYTKLRQPWMLFAMSIDSYQLLPTWAVTLVARTLPWVELALGVLLLAGFWLRYVAGFSTALLGFFLAIMIRSYFKGLTIDCGCFGPGEALGARTLIRDSLLVALSLFLTVAAVAARRPASGLKTQDS